MKKLILTTLDNNDEIYYRCFLPFILSLNATDYCGDIGVIDYGLSEAKKQVLQQNNVHIFAGEKRFSELLIDRQVSVGLIAEQYHYDEIALYDADIWFPTPTLTIFEQLKDQAKLYCSYDVIYPTFLTACLPENQLETAKEKFEQLHLKQDRFWQAGVMLGSAKAWQHYRNYMRETLNNLAEFRMVYGVDASVLNLYACDTNQILHLPEKYNCLPYWGVKLEAQYNQKGILFSLNGELVEGLHITRYHRTSHEYNYFNFMLNEYFKKGQAFCVNPVSAKIYSEDKSWLAPLTQVAAQYLEISHLECVAMKIKVDSAGVINNVNDVILDFASQAKLVLTNPSDQPVRFELIAQYLPNAHKAMRLSMAINQQFRDMTENSRYDLTLPAGGAFTFICDDLWQQEYGVRLILGGVRLG